MPQQLSPLTATPPPRDWKAFATDEAIRQGVDPELVHRVIDRESKWNPSAISPVGAEGMMQLMPATARGLGVKNAFDPEENIRAGIGHLKARLAARKGDVRLTLADYNAGPAAVEKFKGVPPYKETQGYVAAIDQPPSVELAEDDVELVDEADVELLDEPTPLAGQAAQGAMRLTPGYSQTTDLLRALPAVAGSLLSTVSKAGGPVAAATGAVLGAGGAALGEAATIGAEQLAYRTGLSGVPPPPLDASLDRLQSSALVGAGGELVGRGLGAVASKGTAPFAGTVDATGQEVQRMFPDALPNQVADSRALDAATAVAEASIAGGKRITQRKASLATQAQQEAFSIVHKYGGPVSPEGAGKVFQEALEGNTSAFKQHASKLYADVDNLSKGVRVDLAPLKEFAAEQLEKRAGVPGEVSGNRGLKMLQQVARAGEDAADDVQAKELAKGLGVKVEDLADPKYAKLREAMGVSDTPMAKDMTFQQAQTFRSDLLSFIRRAKAEKDDVARGTAQQLVKRLDEAMDAAGATSPELQAAYGTANKFYREGKAKYESELMRGLADEYPERVVEALVKPRATTPIREARAAIGDEGWKKVQARVADDILTAAQDGDIIRGDKLLGRLETLSSATLKEVFPGEEGRALWTLGRVLERSQRKSNPYAKTGILLAQGGVLVGAASFNVDPTTAAGIILTPALLTRVLTSKTGAKWLTTGLEAPKGSKMAAQAGRKLLEQVALTEGGGRPSGQAPPQEPAPTTARYPYRGAPPPQP